MYPTSYGAAPNFPSDSDFQRVQRDEASGLGVITVRAFEVGDMVAALAGEIVTEMTQHTLQIEPGRHLLDLYFCGYFLHSCDPNVHLNLQGMYVTALRSIEPGDHLLMDYAQTEEFLFKQFPCQCGSSQCRGWITGSLEQPNKFDPAFRQYQQYRLASA